MGARLVTFCFAAAGAFWSVAASAAPLPAELNGVWALEPGRCPDRGQIASGMDRGFPAIIRIAKSRVVMTRGACRFTQVVKSRVGQVWAVHLSCKRDKESWEADYVYVLRGGRLAVIDVNGLAVSYQRCK